MKQRMHRFISYRDSRVRVASPAPILMYCNAILLENSQIIIVSCLRNPDGKKGVRKGVCKGGVKTSIGGVCLMPVKRAFAVSVK